MSLQPFSERFTLEAFKAELEAYHRDPNADAYQCNPKDHTDINYRKKYAHNMPPLEAYRYLPPRALDVSVEGDNNKRYFFYAWDNLTDYEKE